MLFTIKMVFLYRQSSSCFTLGKTEAASGVKYLAELKVDN